MARSVCSGAVTITRLFVEEIVSCHGVLTEILSGRGTTLYQD